MSSTPISDIQAKTRTIIRRKLESKLNDKTKIKIKKKSFVNGSYMTELFCKCREYAYKFKVIRQMHPNASKNEIHFRKAALITGIIFFGVVGIVTTIPGLTIRSIA